MTDDIRDIFRASLQDPAPKELVTEGKKKKRKKQPIKAPHERSGNDHLPPPVKTEDPAPIKAKKRTGKQAQKDKQDLKNYDESVSEAALLEDLFNNEQYQETYEFSEEDVKMMKKAYMAGFLSSTNENNGKSCKAVYKNSALQPGADVWNRTLRERFNRFVYNEKKKRKEGK